jgi:tetratricopeptide (TPR) repeat protein
MPKEKFKKFKLLIRNLLPHEVDYLLNSIKTSDPEKIEILTKVYNFVQRTNPEEVLILNEGIDKRKYSKFLQQINLELGRIDVDQKLQWINETHELILLDKISPEREMSLMSAAKRFQSSDFNFMKFYDMLVSFKHYLLIRMRYNEYLIIDKLTQKYQYDYQKSKLVYEQLQQATLDIIGLGGAFKKEAIQWKNWLFQNFKDHQLDGLNRHMSAIRYIFVCLRYGDLDDLGEALRMLDKFFENGANYSRRLLVNFYDNMLVYYDKMGNYAKARTYGYLSIKYDEDDSIIYRNNLTNLLIKNEQFYEALSVIESADFRIKKTRNFHSTIGFIANHIRCLTKTDRIKEAVVKGRVFLKAYTKNILKYRWHRFFAAYHGALLSQGLYSEIIKNTEKFKLKEKELSRSSKAQNKRILSLYYYIAQVQMKKIDSVQFTQFIKDLLLDHSLSNYDAELGTIINQMLVQPISKEVF